MKPDKYFLEIFTDDPDIIDNPKVIGHINITNIDNPKELGERIAKIIKVFDSQGETSDTEDWTDEETVHIPGTDKEDAQVLLRSLIGSAGNALTDLGSVLKSVSKLVS